MKVNAPINDLLYLEIIDCGIGRSIGPSTVRHSRYLITSTGTQTAFACFKPQDWMHFG